MSREPGLKTTANFRSELMLEGSPLSFAMGHVIFKQGGHGNSFFYIVEGQVELQFDGRTRRILRTGDFFGELRVLGNLPRTATATCLTACQLIMLTAEQLNALVAEVPSVRKMILSKYGARLMHSRMRAHTEKIPLKDADYVEIISKFEPLSISREYRLITEGDPSDALYLVLRGTLKIIQDGVLVAVRHAGDFVGEVGMMNGNPSNADVVALEEVDLLVCSAAKCDELRSRFPAFKKYLRAIASRRK